MTVVFADVVEFTSLAEQLDPEELRSFLMGCFQTLAEEIRRYGGFVEKFIGDAILAVFGAPVAHEDDPERAVGAALAMQAKLEELRDSVSDRSGGALAMRIGINSGLVVAGTVGEGKDYGVVGDTVNVAARLQQIGAPGKVTVSEETYRLIRKNFECRSLGAVSLKGKVEPIQAYEVTGFKKKQVSLMGSQSLTSPFFGHEEELKQLRDVSARAIRGKTQVTGLIGEAGIGKSRLLGEFLHQLNREGLLDQIAIYQVTCSSLGSEAYHVFIDFFRTYFSLTGEETLNQARDKITATLKKIGAPIDSILPAVEHVLGLDDKEGRLKHLDPEQLSRQLSLAVKEICQFQCAYRPLILVVEDLQWADTASIEQLRALVDRISDGPLMLLLISRPTPTIGKMYGANVDFTVVRIPLLSPNDSVALIEALIGPTCGPSLSAIRDLLASHGAGNPFFLQEAVRSLIDAGVLVKTPEGTRLTRDLTKLEVPTTVQGIILSRIDALASGPRHLLREASVIGLNVPLELLRQITTQPHELQVYLETLVRAELLAEVPGTGGRPAEYRFRNSLIQEVAYNTLLRKRRAALHLQIASSIERLYGDHLEEYLPQLAHHYSLSDDDGRALQYLLRFGDKAAGIYANQDAVSCYRRALEILEQQGNQSTLKANVLEKLADAYNALGEPEVALQHWQTVLAHYEALGEKQALASVRRKVGLAWWNRGDSQKAMECFQSGLDLLAEEPESVEKALLYHELARLYFRIGDDEEAIHWSEKALDLGQRLEDAEVISHTSNTLGVSMARRGKLDEGIAKVQQSLATALEHGLLGAACRAYTNLGMLLAAIDRHQAVTYCQEGLELAKKIGDLSQQSWLFATIASSYCSLAGDCTEGVEAAKASIALDHQLGQRNHLPIPLLLMAQIFQCQNQLEDSERYYLEAVSIAEEIGEPQLLFPCYDGLGTLYLSTGETSKAESYLAKGQEICEKTGYTPDALIMLPFLC